MEILESIFKNEDDIVNVNVKKVSIVLVLEANDFIPKFHNISHKKMPSLFMSNEHFRLNLFQKSEKNIHQLNTTVYKDFIKTLFSSISNIQVSFEEVRHNSMFCKQRKTTDQIDTSFLRNAKLLLLPPKSCLERMAELVNLQIEFLETTGDSTAKLPNFLEKDCLKKTETGEVEYHFGPLARENIEHLLGNHTRQMNKTPQKGKRKKKMLTSTPSKANTSST
ncbi:unnamed protein product [Mytilus coruscus]|uniref:Uncharacterized protein n=1 Tax=Mytilus coruscus TaxID=42192 RepID=A0A6J7ZVQ4_MYTCO|nr:unnamed protein product [Mytilus coruscus]